MSKFEAGIGVREITPPPGRVLWGYSNRSGPATGELDPLYAKAIAFRADGRSLAWVVLDLGRVPLRDDCDAIRERVKPLGLDAVVFHATHTHHAPAVEAFSGEDCEALIARTSEAIEEAVGALQPARIGYGACTIDIAHNRRRLLPDGGCEMIWRNAERLPTEPVDPEARVVRIDAESGAPMAVLVHFACHPVVMGPSNREYSADFVGTLTRIVKAMTDAECVYIQGACGDINPYLDKTPLNKGGIDAAFSTGRIAGEAVTAAFLTIKTNAPETPEVAVYESEIDVGVRWNLNDESQRALLAEAHGGLFDRYIRRLDNALCIPVSVALLNRELALVGMPGEVFVEQQLALKRLAPVPHPLLCGYVNDYHAYFPPIAHAAAGGYGGTVAAYAGLGAAERLQAEGLIGIYTLLGRFKEAYAHEDFAIRNASGPPQPTPD